MAGDPVERVVAVEALIKATHYPYAVAGEQLDLSGQIIRDADLAQSLSTVWIQQVIIGLARERRVSPLEVLKTQPAFLAALSFNTEWARERFPARLVAAKIAEAERLLALLAGGVAISRTMHFDWQRPAK